MTATLESVESHIQAHELDEAQRALDAFQAADDQKARHLYLRGWIKEEQFDRPGALADYEEAISVDSEFMPAVFRAALLTDQMGDAEMAIELYERFTGSEKAPIHALMNLALLYEEAGRLREAECCLKSILEDHPNDRRAQLFLNSVASTRTMVYDEETQREHEYQHQILDRPISDFELSVRSRNCLRQMNIFTLGDLLRTTEAELLSYKNFGETSLNEIKALLQQTGLRLGQALQPADPVARPPAVQAPVDPTAAMNLPVTELELSVRSRKCLQWLGVRTLGELAMRTETELMAIKNFGQTSLTEIKTQLANFGLSFRLPE